MKHVIGTAAVSVSRVLRNRRRCTAAVGLAAAAAAALGGGFAGAAQAIPPPEPSWQSHGPSAPSKATCGASKTLRASEGTATATPCLVTYLSAAGTLYYQGAFKVTYAQSRAGGSNVFSGRIAAGAGRSTTTSRTCGRATWWHGTTRWCYSPTVVYRPGTGNLWARGTLTLHP